MNQINISIKQTSLRYEISLTPWHVICYMVLAQLHCNATYVQSGCHSIQSDNIVHSVWNPPCWLSVKQIVITVTCTHH